MGMKKWGRLLGVLIIAAGLAVCPGLRGDSAPKPQLITIVFTHDLHSHFEPQKVLDPDGGRTELGGMARIKTLMDREEQENPGMVLRLDGGDFSMGTLYHTLFATDAAELRLMGKMGYDATTIGNHEFDFDSDSLARMLNTAAREKGSIPAVVSCNLAVKSPKSGLQAAMAAFPVKPYTVIERGGLRIGVFGLLGKDAAHDLIWGKDMKVDDQIKCAQQTVKILKEKEKTDLIVCLSHSGTSPVKSGSEDEILARKVPGIDVIISGHTHRVLEKPIIAGKTVIAGVGCDGSRLGVLKLKCLPGATVLTDYRLEDVTAMIPADPVIAAEVGRYRKLVDARLAKSGYQSDQILAELGFPMEGYVVMRKNAREYGLGDLINDAIRSAVQKAEGPNGRYLNAAVFPMGEIRGVMIPGAVTVFDVFEVLSLGMGPDKSAGYPLVSFYLTGSEIKSCLETQSTVAPLKGDYGLQVSGVRFLYNPNRVPFDKVYDIRISTGKSGYERVQPDKRYRIATSYMTAVMMAKMGTLTFGIIDVTPKYADGKPIKDMKKAFVDGDRGQPGVQQIKVWRCLADYLRSQPDGNGNRIPDVPIRYAKADSRYRAAASWSPAALFTDATGITWVVLGAAAVLLAAIFLAVRQLIRASRRRRQAAAQ